MSKTDIEKDPATELLENFKREFEQLQKENKALREAGRQLMAYGKIKSVKGVILGDGYHEYWIQKFEELLNKER